MISLALSVILSTALFQVVPVATTGPASDFKPGFICEKDSVPDAEITNALIISKMLHPKFPSPNPYHGSLFSGERLLMYPVITHNWPEERKSEVVEYFVVYQNPGHVVGVFAHTQYNEHVPCSRNAFTPHTPPAPIPTQSLDHYHPFPEPIPGLEGPNFMWLLDEKEDSISREERKARNPIYLITDKFGSFLQVSFLLVNGKHARCNVKTIPNTNFPTLRTNHPINIQMGYICDVFFDDDYLSWHAKAARLERHLSLAFSKLEYLGPKIGRVHVKPIFPFESMDKTGGHSRYFLVMSNKYQVLRVLRYFRNQGYRNCLRQGIDKNQEPEVSDFICDEKTVGKEYLRRSAETACLDISANKEYPKLYRGPRFDVVGPYLISQQISILKLAKVKFRTIITYDCKLAGVVFKTAVGLKRLLSYGER
ncbi:putative ribonuclease f1, partial [Golovinomyces cichoracearum]